MARKQVEALRAQQAKKLSLFKSKRMSAINLQAGASAAAMEVDEDELAIQMAERIFEEELAKYGKLAPCHTPMALSHFPFTCGRLEAEREKRKKLVHSAKQEVAAIWERISKPIRARERIIALIRESSRHRAARMEWELEKLRAKLAPDLEPAKAKVRRVTSNPNSWPCLTPTHTRPRVTGGAIPSRDAGRGGRH